MSNLTNIQRYFKVIDNSLFMTTGNLDYNRITNTITKLADAIHDYDGDTESIWYIGEYGNCYMVDLIVGAYWHYSEWHGGMFSQGYAALSSLGRIFDPGMSTTEHDNEAYRALNSMATATKKAVNHG